MKATKHIGERMSQRGMTKRMIELVMEFGKEQGDKVILNRKATQSILHEMDQLKKDLLKVMDKGGIVVVIDNDTLITTYKA
ncbi:hypothetical protein [Sulfuricurvum sp.]|uniref:hypothetical protein n=1 Tax=Sulfuricurvum sp. TaxID=2025608 RepID=UPI003BAF849D